MTNHNCRADSPQEMENMTTKQSKLGWLAAIFVAVATWPAASSAQSDVIDPEAVNLLRRSTAYVAGLNQFSADTYSTIEVVIATGQKLHADHHAVVSVKRPNKMRAERAGEFIKQTFYYDGKSLSVNLPVEGLYATVAAPPTLEAMLDFARDKLNVVAPAADLLYKNAFDLLSDGLTGAMFVGEADVAGVHCDHLAFRNAQVDWQIFIEQGDKPLPRKYVITSKKMPQAPEFIVVMSKWNTAPKLNDTMFNFTPPKGSIKIDWLPAASAAKK